MLILQAQQQYKMAQEKRWYAAYTRPRSEKKAELELKAKDIKCYLPMRKVLKTWSDRKKWIDEPVFKSYIFIRMEERRYWDAVTIPYVARIISFEGKMVPIPDEQIKAIKKFVKGENEIFDDIEHLTKGDEIEVVTGPLKGLRGHLITHGKREKLLVQIQTINKAFTLNIPKDNVLKVIKKDG